MLGREHTTPERAASRAHVLSRPVDPRHVSYFGNAIGSSNIVGQPVSPFGTLDPFLITLIFMATPHAALATSSASAMSAVSKLGL